MIDEPCRPTRVLPITDVLSGTFCFSPLIEVHQVYILVHCAATSIRLLVRDDLAAVSINELAFLEVLHAS